MKKLFCIAAVMCLGFAGCAPGTTPAPTVGNTPVETAPVDAAPADAPVADGTPAVTEEAPVTEESK
jgi:hypothetical protein